MTLPAVPSGTATSVIGPASGYVELEATIEGVYAFAGFTIHHGFLSVTQIALENLGFQNESRELCLFIHQDAKTDSINGSIGILPWQRRNNDNELPGAFQTQYTLGVWETTGSRKPFHNGKAQLHQTYSESDHGSHSKGPKASLVLSSSTDASGRLKSPYVIDGVFKIEADVHFEQPYYVKQKELTLKDSTAAPATPDASDFTLLSYPEPSQDAKFSGTEKPET